MQDKQQFEQLMLQYSQLKTGSENIRKMIDSENFDDALTYIKSREKIFMNCKAVLRFLELTPEQEEELNATLDELRASETENIKILSDRMHKVQLELQTTQKNEKIKHAYNLSVDNSGDIISVSE